MIEGIASERGSHSIPEAQTTNDVERESKTAEGGGGEETARLMGRPDLEIRVSGLVVINFDCFHLSERNVEESTHKIITKPAASPSTLKREAEGK